MDRANKGAAMVSVSTNKFVSALQAIPLPGGRQIEFLRAHYKAPGRALTATRLAEAVGYKDYRGINLCYGLLAVRIGGELGIKNPSLSLLVVFEKHKEWIFIMRPEFAQALKKAGWL